MFKPLEALALLKERGARVDGEIAYLPKTLVEDCLAKVPSSFRVEAVNPDRSVTVGGDLVIHPAARSLSKTRRITGAEK